MKKILGKHCPQLKQKIYKTEVFYIVPMFISLTALIVTFWFPIYIFVFSIEKGAS